MDLGAEGDNRGRRIVGAGQADHLMAGGDEIGYESGSDPAGRTGNEDAHGYTSNGDDRPRRWASVGRLRLPSADTRMSATVIITGLSATVIALPGICQRLSSSTMDSMARWEPNARDRLLQAALDLYGERGFEQTTVAEIARRAGLTERTFFRYFADKPEVLFSGAGALQEFLVTLVAEAPDSPGSDRRGGFGPRGDGRLLPGSPRILHSAPGRHRREPRFARPRADQIGNALPLLLPTSCAGAASAIQQRL